MSEQPPVKIPSVARTRARRSAVPIAVALTLLGTGVFAKLVTSRASRADAALALPPLQLASTSAPPVPVVLPVTPAVIAAPFVAPTSPTVIPPTAAPVRLVASGQIQPTSATAPTGGEQSKRASPTLIIDLAQTRTTEANLGQVSGTADAVGTGTGVGTGPGTGVGPGTLPTATVGDPTGDAIAAAGVAAQAARAAGPSAGLPGNDGFASRVAGQTVEVAKAERLTNLDSLIPQGAIIGAVMETALNSDLPGYARAIVTRDVLSFDGSQVLIPAGSRVIGQYNSGVAQGASRIFIVWSRLIRSDGVSIALASPATDDLGRGGLAGKVNRHFLQRFGGSILLSVLTGGIQAAASSVARGNTVVVNSASEATSLASQAGRGADIPPTIKTRQGANVRIFVARDLDFSAVGPSTR